MESDSEFEYGDQGHRSSDDESPVDHPEAPDRQGIMQRPHSRLAGTMPPAASAQMQASSMGPPSYDPPPPGSLAVLTLTILLPLGGYNPDEYEDLPVGPEVQDLFQYILQYKPEVLQLDAPLKPFIPEFVPAIGDIDEFIKVSRPDGKPDLLGLKVLDEPAAVQSDPALLTMQLRQASKQASPLVAVLDPNDGYNSALPCTENDSLTAQVEEPACGLCHASFSFRLKFDAMQAGVSSGAANMVAKVEDPAKNSKRITDWIKSIGDLQKGKPGGTVHISNGMPDVEALMQQWPVEVEQKLHSMKLPDATLDVDLHSFVRIVCSVLDIPVYDNPIESLHVLFTLLLEFKNNPAFKSTQMGGLSLAEQKLFQAGSRSESQAGLRSPRAT
ncbi:MAG: intraflagellar transport 46 protein, partial [Trebouxia sp. A1-2]